MLITYKQISRFYGKFNCWTKSSVVETLRFSIPNQNSSVRRFSTHVPNPIPYRIKKMSSFKFTDYDCIGFDLDNTLVSYNITNMALMEYELMAKFMVEQRGWDRDLVKPLLDSHIDFMQKGLILDCDAGNILKLGSDGSILRASHGTRLMSPEELEKTYPQRKWSATSTLVNNPLDVWNGPLSQKVRSLLDYFDLPVSLVFARAVDILDKSSDLTDYKIWPDILDALMSMYEPENFKNDTGNYFTQMKKYPEKYIRKCNPKVTTWLRKLKENKLTFLITGSEFDFANFTASYALGEDWKSLFDIIICYAKKPGFFVAQRPFINVSTKKETGELNRGGIYSQGNWNELEEFFSKVTNIKSPKSVYVGDNLIQDIYIPATYVNCDTVTLHEELIAECSDMLIHPDEKMILSKFWGSYFSDEYCGSKISTFWGMIIKDFSKICIPSIDAISNEIDYSYEYFHNGRSCGFFPQKPLNLASN